MIDMMTAAIFKCFPKKISAALLSMSDDVCADLREIRVRANKPIVVCLGSEMYFISDCGQPFELTSNWKKPLTVTSDELINTCLKLCEFSVYKRQGEINNGFITVDGGHRIGLCGTAVMNEGKIRSVTDISSMNIRIARQFNGCADEFLSVTPVCGTLIVGVPSSGKTTILRDISRQLSTVYAKKVAVIDERFELSASHGGSPYFDMGLCDVYCGYPKHIAAIQAIRTMSPDIVICDELTGDDTESIQACVNLGVTVIASVHGSGLESVIKNHQMYSLLKTGAFERLVLLSGDIPCRIAAVTETEELNLA